LTYFQTLILINITEIDKQFKNFFETNWIFNKKIIESNLTDIIKSKETKLDLG